MAENAMDVLRPNMMPGYKMLSHDIGESKMMDKMNVLSVKAKFEDAFYDRKSPDINHRKKVDASMVEAAIKGVSDADQLKDTKGTHFYLVTPKDGSVPNWTQQVNESLGKKRMEPLNDTDVVVSVDSGKKNSQDFVVIRKMSEEEKKYR